MFGKIRAHRLERSVFSPCLAVAWNLCLVYVAYTLCRLEYLLENYSYFAPSVSEGHLPRLLRGGVVFDTTGIMYTNALCILLLLLPLHWKERPAYHKVCKWLFVVINAVAIAANLADSVYFRFTLRRTTTSVFTEFRGEDNLLAIFGVELLRHWYLVLFFAGLAWALWRLYLTPRIDIRRQRLPRYYAVQTLSLAVAVPLAIGGMRGGWQSGVRPITISNANEYVSRPTECALVLNTPFALIRTLGKTAFVIPTYYNNVEEAERVFSPIHQPADSVRPRKKNVVILIVESFGREYIGAFNRDFFGGTYKGYTPNVDKLIDQSLTYRYSYCNGRKSIDGMPSVLCGIPMFIDPFILTPASMNDYTGIAGLLSGWGYQTAFFHGANRGSMGFLAFANKIGFQDYYGRQDYAADPRFGGDKDFDGNWGIWDEPFLQYYCTKMGEMRQPFMTAVFTVSSHHPFVVPEKCKNTYKEEHLPIQKCIRYTDMAIGRFFESARKQPWFQNTIFVLTSDHTNQSDHAQYQTDLGGFCSPIIIYDPSGDIRPGRVDAVAQQIDILPTVLGYLGYDKPYLSFGIDLLNTPASETFAVNYLNGTYQYVKHGYVLQWDGQKTTGLYRLTDTLMKRNLAGCVPQQAQMERELKAIIYQYMWRMTNNRLLPNK